mmetsp:Transcript_8989/g.11711  ORF Transcript_8989/g.11711 Transcript_8989/m.11711 type:complete len:441 (+) Transcript_8989:142-1464(+)
MSTNSEREFQVVLFGATGWTGVHAVEYLAENYPPSSNIKWALASRSLEKLKVIKARMCNLLGKESWGENVELIVADSMDDAALADICRRTSAVASVVGPYALYGEPLVRACVEQGTHYVDITGEPQWIKKMIKKYGETAKRNGVFVIPSTGFDSVPSDLGTFLVVQRMKEKYGKECKFVRGYNGNAKQNNRLQNKKNGPKPMGGTLASVHTMMTKNKDEFLKVIFEPYSLISKAERKQQPLMQHADRKFWLTPFMAGYDQDLGQYTSHFPMSWVNEKTVRRSAYLLGYGTSFSYREGTCTGSDFFKAVTITLVFFLIYVLIFLPFEAGASILKVIAPLPSQLPPEKPEDYKPGYFEWYTVATSVGRNPNIVRLHMLFPDDPGYTETSKMMLESALCLALPEVLEEVKEESQMHGGVLTPAVLGNSLYRRLEEKNVKFSFS